MENGVLFEEGGHLQIREDGKAPVLVPFPICLAIKFGNNLFEDCPDFALNIKEAWVFVRTGSPLPEGTSLLMHFYIPPEIKLLAEVRGKVVPMADSGLQMPLGMMIRFTFFSRWKLKRLGGYTKGERHLVNETA